MRIWCGGIWISDPDCIRMSVSEEWFPKQDPRAGGTIYIWTLGAHRTAHSVARDFGHEDVFQLLLERTPEDLKLALACELGDEAAFHEFLSKHPDAAKTLSEADQRKLPNAAQTNNTEAVRLMLEAGWPVDTPGEMGATALHWAGFNGNAEMAREILRFHPALELKSREYAGTRARVGGVRIRKRLASRYRGLRRDSPGAAGGWGDVAAACAELGAQRRGAGDAAMNASRRPISVTIVACLYLAVGAVGFVYHFRELLMLQRDSVWIELTEVLALVSGAFMLRGHNWARWLALAWIAFHVILSIFDSGHGLVVHGLFCAVIAWILFRPEAARYFRGQERLIDV